MSLEQHDPKPIGKTREQIFALYGGRLELVPASPGLDLVTRRTTLIPTTLHTFIAPFPLDFCFPHIHHGDSSPSSLVSSLKRCCLIRDLPYDSRSSATFQSSHQHFYLPTLTLSQISSSPPLASLTNSECGAIFLSVFAR